jgi:predicted lactoylglutathione lyase
LSNHHVVLPWCAQALAFIELPVDNVNKTSMFYLQCIFKSETCCSKNAEAAENGQMFHFLSVFQRPVTHTRVANEARQAVTIKARVCCVRVLSFSILVCIILAVATVYNFF